MLWVVIPTYNERENVEPFLRALNTQLRERPHRLLIVDDSSPDSTGDAARALADELPVEVLTRPGKQGLGRAYVAGFQRALEGGAELIAQMDCDFSHDPVDLLALLAEVDRGADFAIGSRYIPGGDTSEWSRGRLILSRTAALSVSLLLRTGVRDSWGGFKVWRSSVLRAINLDAVNSDGFSFQVETTFLAHRRGFHPVEVPIHFRERRAGHSKMHGGLIVEGLVKLPRLLRAERRLARQSERG